MPQAIAAAFAAVAEFRAEQRRQEKWHDAQPGIYYWTDYAGAKRLYDGGTPTRRIKVPSSATLADEVGPKPVLGLTYVGDLGSEGEKAKWITYADYLEAKK